MIRWDQGHSSKCLDLVAEVALLLDYKVTFTCNQAGQTLFGISIVYNNNILVVIL